MKATPDSLLARCISESVQPAVQEVATRLLYLTTYRPGSAKRKPSVNNLYETTFAQAIFEHLLMDPRIQHLDIRHEEPCGKERIDIWLRSDKGGAAHYVEIGFYSKKKVEEDLQKLARIKPKEIRWMLALFRGKEIAREPKDTVSASLGRKNGLDDTLMSFNPEHSGRFEVSRPGKKGDHFGFALLKGK